MDEALKRIEELEIEVQYWKNKSQFWQDSYETELKRNITIAGELVQAMNSLVKAREILHGKSYKPKHAKEN